MDAVRDGPLALVVAIGVLLQAPWLVRPFGFFEFSAGYYFGPFAQAYARFGFLNLRGIPLANYDVLLTEPQNGYAYFNHPPGTAWLLSALGTSEWQIRLPGALATIAAGVLLALLLRPRVGPWCAAATGVLLQTFPVLAFASQNSYESIVLACGLCMVWAFERAAAGGRGAKATMAVAAAVGSWMDWSFGFFVLALLPLAGPGNLRALVRRLALPWLVALGSVALIALWMLWAKSAPFLQVNMRVESGGAMLDRVFGDLPPIGPFVRVMGEYLADGFSLPGLVVAAVGLPFWFRSDWRLATALLVPAILNVVLFAKHSYGHWMFWCYFAVTAAASIAALLHACRRLPFARAALPLAFAALTVAPTIMTIRLRNSGTVPVFAEIGAVLTRLAEEIPADATQPTIVATNANRFYPYYVRSSKVYLVTVDRVETLEGALKNGSRLRFVYLSSALEDAEGAVQSLDKPELLAWLQQFPRRELPTLVGSWPFGKDGVAHISAAWVFEL